MITFRHCARLTLALCVLQVTSACYSGASAPRDSGADAAVPAPTDSGADAALPAHVCRDAEALFLLENEAWTDAGVPALRVSTRPSGVFRCADGTAHRVDAVPCPAITVEFDGTGFPPTPGLMSTRNGVTIVESACSVDADCGAGKSCMCAVARAGDASLPVVSWTECVPSNCDDGRACGSLECGLQRGICGVFDALYCRTPTDSCQFLAQCLPRHHCVDDGLLTGLRPWQCVEWDGDCD